MYVCTYEVGVALQAWTTPAPTIRSRRAASFKVPQEQAQFCCALSYRTVPGPDDGSLQHLDDRPSAFVSFTCMHVAQHDRLGSSAMHPVQNTHACATHAMHVTASIYLGSIVKKRVLRHGLWDATFCRTHTPASQRDRYWNPRRSSSGAEIVIPFCLSVYFVRYLLLDSLPDTTT